MQNMPSRPIDLNLVVTRNSPCSQQGNDWRECLKEDDFMPDRDLKKCESFRKDFYACVKAWRAKQEPLKPGQSGAGRAPGSMPELCSGLSDKLRVCMEISMFETAKCQKEMSDLRDCVARVDPEVAAVNKEVADDLKRQQDMEDQKMQIPQLTMMEQRVWHKLWNDKPERSK